MKHILLTNDDGIDAPGLTTLREILLRENNISLTVVAPDSQRSAAGHSMTLYHPVKVFEQGDGRYATDGTPADCVKTALGLFPDIRFDLVVSGINRGPNLGMDTYYSGTVAAAREAAFYGIPALAVSLAVFDFMNKSVSYQTAAEITAEFIRTLLDSPVPEGSLYNLNIPDLPFEQISGYRQTRLGGRVFQEELQRRETPFGQSYFWLACLRSYDRAVPGTDLDAVLNHAVSITPLKLDATGDGLAADCVPEMLEQVQISMGGRTG